MRATEILEVPAIGFVTLLDEVPEGLCLGCLVWQGSNAWRVVEIGNAIRRFAKTKEGLLGVVLKAEVGCPTVPEVGTLEL